MSLIKPYPWTRPIKEEEIEALNEVLSTLDPLLEKVLRMRCGLYDRGLPYTLQDIGTLFGLTLSRIRQLEGRALRRLRHPKRTVALLPLQRIPQYARLMEKVFGAKFWEKYQ